MKYLSDQNFPISSFAIQWQFSYFFTTNCYPLSPSTFFPALVLRSVKTYFEIERHFNIIKLHFPKATHNELIYTCGMNGSSVTLETEHSRLCNNFIMNGKMFSPNTYSPSGNFRFCHRRASSPLPEPTLNQWRKSGITFSSSALAHPPPLFGERKFKSSTNNNLQFFTFSHTDDSIRLDSTTRRGREQKRKIATLLLLNVGTDGNRRKSKIDGKIWNKFFTIQYRLVKNVFSVSPAGNRRRKFY